MSETIHAVIVVGGGPAGLSAAHELVKVGITPLVLERTARVGDVWRQHYEGLRLNTGRWFSNLPGLRFPWAAGRWPTRTDLAEALAAMPARGGFEVRTGTQVAEVRQGAGKAPWEIALANGETLLAQSVVIATGCSNLPSTPAWPGADGFTGKMLHARDFQRAENFAGQHVLVVGSGNTACEIATRLVPHAASVTISVRRSPHLLPKSLWGIPFAAVGAAIRHLPAPRRDRILMWLSRRWTGDLSPHGLPAPTQGVSQLGTVTPTLFMPIIEELRAGRIRVVGPIQEMHSRQVQVQSTVQPTADSLLVQADAVIAGTGYRTGLEQLLSLRQCIDAQGKPHTLQDGITSPVAGLFFIGYVNPLSGQLREIGRQAPALARAVELHQRRFNANGQATRSLPSGSRTMDA